LDEHDLIVSHADSRPAVGRKRRKRRGVSSGRVATAAGREPPSGVNEVRAVSTTPRFLIDAVVQVRLAHVRRRPKPVTSDGRERPTCRTARPAPRNRSAAMPP